MSDHDPYPPKDEKAQDEGNLEESSETDSTLEDVGSTPEETTFAPSDKLGQGSLAEKDERVMAMLSHILGVVTSFVGPLVIWVLKHEESPFVDNQGKEAVNFQITIMLGMIAGTALGAVTGGCVSAIFWPILLIGGLIYSILGGLAANKGVAYRYPYTLRLIK